MSTKNVDIAVRELTKTVLALDNKVSTLVKLITDQNCAIKKLASLCDKDVATAIVADIGAEEGTKQPPSAVRPVRDAHARAISALTVNSRKGKEGRKMSPAVPPPAEANKLRVPTDDDCVRASTSHSAPTTPSSAASSSRTQLQPPVVVPHPVRPVAPDAQRSRQPTASCPRTVDALMPPQLGTAADYVKDSEWSEVKRRNTRRSPPANIIRGTAIPDSAACTLMAAERKTYLHLYYVNIGTTVDQVRAHLDSICPGSNCTVDALKSRGDYTSFKLTIPAKHIDKYMSPDHWAEGVCVKPWRSGFRKPTDAD